MLRTLALEGGELDLFGVLNDRTADGRDVSWVWDADWELLVAERAPLHGLGHARRRARAADEVRRPGPASASTSSTTSSRASTRRSQHGDGPLYVVPTYTALLELRELLTRRGQAEAYWR